MFFEHIFRSSAFLTVFACFTAFSASHIFATLCDFLSISALILSTMTIFLKSLRFFDAANLFFAQLKLSRQMR